LFHRFGTTVAGEEVDGELQRFNDGKLLLEIRFCHFDDIDGTCGVPA
jgi:hypothetical protein